MIYELKEPVITAEEKEYLLHVNLKEFLTNLSTIDILYSIFARSNDFDVVINNYSLVGFYNMFTSSVALLFPQSLAERHRLKKSIIILQESGGRLLLGESVQTVDLTILLMTYLNWEESLDYNYRYKISIGNIGVSVLDTIKRIPDMPSVEHYNFHKVNKQDFGEFCLSLLLLYNDFVSLMPV